MALDRLVPISTTPGTVGGNTYMDAVSEEITGLWDRSTITLTSVSGTNTIAATATPALTGSLGGSMNFILKAAATNSSAVTLNINSGGAVAVVDAEGTALAAGALRINANYLLHYDSGIAKFVVVGYIPASVVPIGSKLIKTQVAASSASLDFVNGVSAVVMDDTYDDYELVLSNLKPASDDVELWFVVGTGAGPTYQSANYRHLRRQWTDALADISNNSASDAKIILAGGAAATDAVGSATGENATVTVRFSNPETTDYMLVNWHGGYVSSIPKVCSVTGSGSYQAGTAITAVRVMFESGNIASGRATLYGRTKA